MLFGISEDKFKYYYIFDNATNISSSCRTFPFFLSIRGSAWAPSLSGLAHTDKRSTFSQRRGVSMSTEWGLFDDTSIRKDIADHARRHRDTSHALVWTRRRLQFYCIGVSRQIPIITANTLWRSLLHQDCPDVGSIITINRSVFPL